MRTLRSGLTQRQARVLALTGLLLTVLLFGGTITFAALGWGRCEEAFRSASDIGDRACRIMLGRNDIGGVTEGLGFGFLGVIFAGLGAVLGSRRPTNPLGWIFLGAGFVFAANSFVTPYAIHATEAPGTMPLALFAAVAVEVLGGPVIFAPFVLFFLLFPDGHVLSPRWRIAVWAIVLSIVVQTFDLALHPMPLRLAPLNVNPLGLGWLTNDVRMWIQTPAFALLLVCVVASVVGLILRFRRSRGVERQQMKWFTTSAAFVGLTFAFAPLFWAMPQLEVIWGPLFLLATMSVPVAATLAILRYRLYDIDVLINRALVYGGLTALLALTYLGLVVLLQSALSGLGGGSDIAVAASTLAVAALFQPLRSRLQTFIDRRFYRRKYNALRTVESFSATLRQETDLNALRSELLGAVHETIQPARATVWLRGERPA